MRNKNETGNSAEVTMTPKGMRTRIRLKECARQEFGRLGSNNARVADIAKAAGVSHGTFYRYFDDKTDVRDELLQDLLVDVAAFARASWTAEDPLHSVFVTTERYLAFYSENQDLYRILIEVAQQEPQVKEMWSETRAIFYRRIGRMLTRASEQGILREGLDPEIAAILLGGMTEHAAYLIFVAKQCEDWNLSTVSEQVSLLWESGAFELKRKEPDRLPANETDTLDE